MKIGLIDIDYNGQFPNIAQMKIAAYHKAKGDDVDWYMPFNDRYDIVYISKVFTFSPDIEDCINANRVVRGGTGYAIRLINGIETYDPQYDKPLPPEIEHIFPDYSIYKPELTGNTAYGFLTRGCPRGCNFCHVAPKEGKRSIKVADVSEFWNGQKRLVLCDPNILACAEWESLFKQIAATHAIVNFNQGLDVRLLTPEKIELINKLKFEDIHFAWDRYDDKDIVLPKFKMYSEMAKYRPHGALAGVYTLTNYDTTFDQDLERVYILRDLGYEPYIMIYDKQHADHKYTLLQNWVNNRIIWAKCARFEDYDHTRSIKANKTRK